WTMPSSFTGLMSTNPRSTNRCTSQVLSGWVRSQWLRSLRCAPVLKVLVLFVFGVAVGYQLDQVVVGVTHIQTGPRTQGAGAGGRLVKHGNSGLLEKILRFLHGSFPAQAEVRRTPCIAGGEGRALDLISINHIKVQLLRFANADDGTSSPPSGSLLPTGLKTELSIEGEGLFQVLNHKDPVIDCLNAHGSLLVGKSLESVNANVRSP